MKMQALRMALGLLAALLSLPAVAIEIEEAEDLLHGRWYATEVIIFERLRAAEAGPEDLVRTGNRAYPANLRAMAEAQPWKAAELAPLTRACLEFPRLEVRRSSPCQASADSCINAGLPTMSTENIVGRCQAPAADCMDAGADAAGGAPPSIHPTLASHPLLDLLSAAARTEQALRQNSYRWLGTHTLQLRTEARRIRRAPDMRVIRHGRWMQPAPPRNAGEPLLLQVGPQSGGVHALEGTLQITLGRYLHFQAELWRPARSSAQTPAASEPGEREPFPYVTLNQSRAMRSGELHYLDHPQIGVLVRIDPVPPPPELAAALETWKQAEADG